MDRAIPEDRSSSSLAMYVQMLKEYNTKTSSVFIFVEMNIYSMDDDAKEI